MCAVHKKSASQETLSRHGYANNFGHSVGGEGYRGVEGVLLANLSKSLVSRCVSCTKDLFSNDSIVSFTRDFSQIICFLIFTFSYNIHTFIISIAVSVLTSQTNGMIFFWSLTFILKIYYYYFFILHFNVFCCIYLAILGILEVLHSCLLNYLSTVVTLLYCQKFLDVFWPSAALDLLISVINWFLNFQFLKVIEILIWPST